VSPGLSIFFFCPGLTAGFLLIDFKLNKYYDQLIVKIQISSNIKD
jgi:hypothetical protein